MKKAAFVVWLCSAVSLFGQTSLVDQGRAALSRDPEKAATLLEKAVAESPNNAEAHYLLGSAYGSMAQHASIFGQPGLAKKTHDEFERAVQLDPNLIDARLGLIEYYMLAPGFMGGDREKAVQQANEIKKRDVFDGHRAFATIYRHEKKPELARKEYVDAVKEMPTSAKARYWLGISYLTADKNYKEAAEQFEAAIKVDASYMPAWFRIGQMAALSGTTLQRGEEALQKYLAYTPDHTDPPLYRAHYWLGVIYEKEGRKAEARQSFATSLKINPSQPDVAEALKKIS